MKELLQKYAPPFFAGMAGAAVMGYVLDHAFPSKPQIRTVTVATQAPSATTVARLAAEQWPELEQAKVDALSAGLAATPPERRKAVVIFCHDDAKCGDIGLNLENSFETAKWAVERRAGPPPDSFGIQANDAELAAVITRALGVPVGLFDAGPTSGFVVVLGRRPKG